MLVNESQVIPFCWQGDHLLQPAPTCPIADAPPPAPPKPCDGWCQYHAREQRKKEFQELKRQWDATAQVWWPLMSPPFYTRVVVPVIIAAIELNPTTRLRRKELFNYARSFFYDDARADLDLLAEQSRHLHDQARNLRDSEAALRLRHDPEYTERMEYHRLTLRDGFDRLQAIRARYGSPIDPDDSWRANPSDAQLIEQIRQASWHQQRNGGDPMYAPATFIGPIRLGQP
jgi:hypothetical protein